MTDQKFLWETPEFLHDWPLLDVDKTYFYFDEYARTVARLLTDKSTRTPITLGISGPWGTGKTTLMQRVRKMLDETKCLSKDDQPTLLSFANSNENVEKKYRVCRTVWFDAWKYSGEDHILAALLRAIVIQMHTDGFLNMIKAELTGPKKKEIRWAGFLLNALTKYVSLGTYELNLVDYEKETAFNSASAFFDYFDQSLSRLINSWIYNKIIGNETIDEQKGILVIFIDDLDRCLPTKTVEVLETIKLFLDKVGCAFVLGADIDIIQKAVMSQYANVDVTGENAKDYLEKIIQLRFELPPILSNVMKNYLEVEQYGDQTVLDNWSVLMAGADMNIRRVKSLINEINFQWAVLTNTKQAANINRNDFVRWSILARSAPRDFIQQLRNIGDLNSPDLQKKYLDDLLDWAIKASEDGEQRFKQYASYRRFRMVLRAIGCFSSSFDATVLNSFLHLVSPPSLQVVEPISIEVSGAVTISEPMDIQNMGVPDITDINQEGVLEVWGIQFLKVPAGEFVMGSRDDNPSARKIEKPQTTYCIPYDFWITRYLITNRQFSEYMKLEHSTVLDTGNLVDHPAVNIDLSRAFWFCNWLNRQFKNDILSDCEISLPNEPEWEKAARGLYGNEWPWGNNFEAKLCNTREGGVGTTTPIGKYSPMGDSPFGCSDMVGNVWEWTRSKYRPYPYDDKIGERREETISKNELQVLRGGSFTNGNFDARCAVRGREYPSGGHHYIGIRLVIVPKSAINL